MLRALLPLALLAFQAPTIALAPAKDAKVSHTVALSLGFGGIAATVNMDTETTYTDVTDSTITAEQTVSNLKITANENPMEVPASTIKLQYGRDGALKSVGGGISGTDAAYTHLLFRFVPTPAETGKTTTVEFKGDTNLGLPDQKVESTYLGPKKSGDVDGYEFKQVTKAGELESTTDFVVKADGTILEASSSFKGLPVPAANGNAASGTGTMKIKG